MNKCLKILLTAKIPTGFLHDYIQKHARKYNIEGTVQVIQGKIRIIACGEKNEVDEFLEMLHKGSTKADYDEMEIEPFLKEKDYRGVFRVIE